MNTFDDATIQKILIGYRQPLIFQYIYHIKLTTLRPCI